MRSMLFSLVLLAAVGAEPAMARQPFGMAGCGLGSMLFGPDGGQLSAATTNESTSSQGFGITSGTSNCVEGSKAAALSAQQQFIADNFSTLSREIAQGDGEALRAFSNTFGCDAAAYPVFAGHMQQSYGRIFAAPGSMSALTVIQTEIKDHDRLAAACDLVI